MSEPEIDIPDSFEGLDEALSKTTTSDLDAKPRCPKCGTVKIFRKKSSFWGGPKRKDGDYRCNQCTNHFDEPEPPRREVNQ